VRHPKSFVLEGDAAIVSGAVCLALRPVLQKLWARAREGGNEEVADGCEKMLTVAGAYSAKRTGVSGIPRNTGESTPSAPARMIAPMTTSQVATRLGCGERNVRALAKRKTLRGRQISGRWLFERADVDAYAAERVG
jgi:excisionase family DNA binding protein